MSNSVVRQKERRSRIFPQTVETEFASRATLARALTESVDLDGTRRVRLSSRRHRAHVRYRVQ
jgi:hypothetical protein